jgi:RNA polymerase sigma factor (sigma-70 family)
MRVVEQLLHETLSNGELDRQLRGQHAQWRHLWDFGEFREEVLSRAWEAREQFRGKTAGEFLAWLRPLAWSAAVDHWRKVKREIGLLQRLALLIPRWPVSTTEAVDTRDLVEWLLAGLSDRERKLLVLMYYRHMPADALARELGMTTAAVHQLHYRAIGKLRRRLKNRLE